ncbi:peptidylprolyl isomerase [Cohnella sp. CFH 77786]|uniref:peptidylprolyl isomerase n=1 Tax=Cohnella sp. CFH 77786 TaxID=2662265 RepID=UPI001C609F8F|nr:peptidylprolyl isomerase [Cohnella sp. CFH 77786]MBW5446758.1 peptidylprolyl isomerase [Cohnella sp. CFH 77786]
MNDNENKRAEEPLGQEDARSAEPAVPSEEAGREEAAAAETADAAAGAPGMAPEASLEVAAATARKASAPWPWIAVAMLAVAALVFVLVRENQQAGGGSGNAVVGRMDGASFTKADLYEELVKQMPEGQAASALDNLMLTKMVDLEAGKLGISVNDADVNAEIAKYKKSFPSDAEFESALQQSGMTMDRLKEQVDVTVKLRSIFEPQIKPTEDQLKKYYQDNQAKYGTPEQIRASHILLPTKAEAEAVLAELKKGADFATLAKEKSTDPGSKDKGGDLDFFGKGVMNEPFETAAFKLQVGEISGVVESPNGFHIIKVTDKKAAVTPAYDTVKQQVKNDYLDAQIPAKINEWLEAKKKEYHYENLLAAPPASGTPAPSASASASPSPSSGS